MMHAVSYPSHFATVYGSNIHYYDEGDGDPILFLQGAPATNYLWRNVIPHAIKSGRCIAPDLIGLGKSDRPDISYTTEDHIKYIDAFIDTLGLKNLTLVMHGWGSVIGLDYMRRHPENVKSIVVLEGHIRADLNWGALSLPLQQMLSEIKTFLSDKIIDIKAMSHYFFDRIFPNFTLHPLLRHEVDAYRISDCAKPLLQYFKELNFGQTRQSTVDIINRYSEALTQSSIPKLMFYAIPGFVTTVDTLAWSKENLKNLIQIDLGDGLHYLPETHPELIGRKIAEFHRTL